MASCPFGCQQPITAITVSRPRYSSAAIPENVPATIYTTTMPYQEHQDDVLGLGVVMRIWIFAAVIIPLCTGVSDFTVSNKYPICWMSLSH